MLPSSETASPRGRFRGNARQRFTALVELLIMSKTERHASVSTRSAHDQLKTRDNAGHWSGDLEQGQRAGEQLVVLARFDVVGRVIRGAGVEDDRVALRPGRTGQPECAVVVARVQQ